MPRLLGPLFILSLCLLSPAQQTVPDRIVRPIDTHSLARLHGTLHPLARTEFDRGPVSPTLHLGGMALVFKRTPEQEAALKQLLAEQQDRSSPNYHKWLTPTEFADRFGLSPHDIDLVAAWLRSQGFTVTDIPPSRTLISFSGIAAQVDAAFHAQLHNYLVDGKLHYAPSAEPSIPAAFAEVVSGITSLYDFHPKPHAIVHHQALPRLTSNASGNHFIAPGDLGVIYDLPDYISSYDSNANIQTVFQPGLDGTGQTIAIVGQASDNGNTAGDVSVATATSNITSDNATFRSVSNLPPNNPTLTVTGTPAPTYFAAGEFTEASLDIQWAGAVVPNANIVFVYSTDAFQSLQYIVNNRLAQVVSVSYGDCEAHFTLNQLTTMESELAAAQSFGMAVIASAGDNGAADCDGTPQNPTQWATHGLAVDYPASSIYVTGMGGTQFNGDLSVTAGNGSAPATLYWDASSSATSGPSAFSYIPEAVWNEVATANLNIAGGGGASSQFAKPSWQSGVTANDGQRDVPDLSFSASADHDGYLICSLGSCQTGYRRNSDQTFTVTGGTSAATPVFAGVAALVNQKLGQAQGNLNPAIYSVASGSSSWAFHDTITGSNSVNCQSGSLNCTPVCQNCGSGTLGYAAGPGYDQASGWGTLDVAAFVNALANSPQPSFNLVRQQATVTGTSTVGGTSASFQVDSTQGFSGNVNLTCASSNLPGLSCQASPVSITPSTPGSAYFNIPIDYSQTFGTMNGTILFTGTAGSITNSVPLPATITYRDFTLSTSDPSLTLAAGSSQTELLGVLSNQLNQELDLACTTDNPQVTCSPATTAITDSGSYNRGITYTIASTGTTAATSTLTLTGTSSPLTHSVQLAVTVIVPDFTLTAANPTLYLTSGGTGTTTLTVTPGQLFSSNVALSCSVAGLGSTTCSINPNTVTGGNGTATLTIQAATLAINQHAPFLFWPRKGTLTSLAFAVGFVLILNPPRRRPRHRSATSLSLLVFAVVMGTASCGGGHSSAASNAVTPLSGTVTVTGSGANQTHTVTVNVNISQA